LSSFDIALVWSYKVQTGVYDTRRIEMSAVGTVEAMYAEFARGELGRVLELLDPEVEWVTPPTLPWSSGSYRGREGVAEYFTSFGTALEDARVEPEELIECGDRVVALGSERGRSRATGRAFEARFAHVLTVRDGRVVQMRGHVDTAAVVAAFEG
jgi:ketosteroid isomerase-like protein